MLLLGVGLNLSAQTLPMTSSATTNPGEVLFTISGVPILPGAHPSRLYRVFWDFGDGTYETETYTEAAMVGLGYNLVKTHVYDDTDPHNVRAELTQVYTPPDKKNLRYSTPTGPVSAVTAGSPTIPLKNLYGQSVRVDRTRNPRKDFATNFLLTYEVASNPVCNVARNGGILEVDYGLGLEPDLSLMDAAVWDEAEGYHGENITVDLALRKITVGIASDFAAANDQRELILNFFTPAKTKTTSSFFHARLADSTGNDCGEVFDRTLAITDKRDPYDPNFKVVAEDTITLNEPQWLNYILQCQNIGEGPTDSITIVDVLDPRLDPTTLEVQVVRMGFEEIGFPLAAGAVSVPAIGVPAAPFSFNYKMEQAGANVVWKLYDTGQLRGLMEPTMGQDFVERETIAQIEFRVKTYCFEDDLARIPNLADVYFDSLAPVQTDTAFTDKFCCQQHATGFNGVTFDLLQYALGALNAPFDTANTKILSFTSDSLAGMGQPITLLTNGRLEYQPIAGGFTGIDMVRFLACDQMGTCDTFTMAICVDMNPALYVCDTTKCLSVGLEDEVRKSLIWTYPNPFEEVLKVKNDESIRSVELFDLFGNRVFVKAYAQSVKEVSLSLAQLPVGMYVIRINEDRVGKVVKR